MVLHCTAAKKINILFLLSMCIILVTDIFIYIDFKGYYNSISVLISIFYVVGVFALRSFISKDDVKFGKFISFPVGVSVILIGYLVYAITELVLPEIKDSFLFIALIVLSMLLFCVVSFFIYTADRFEKSMYPFIAACCTLFVDALLTINELYYYSRVFTVIINITEIIGIYFFAIFFIRAKPRDVNSSKKFLF